MFCNAMSKPNLYTKMGTKYRRGVQHCNKLHAKLQESFCSRKVGLAVALPNFQHSRLM